MEKWSRINEVNVHHLPRHFTSEIQVSAVLLILISQPFHSSLFSDSMDRYDNA